MDDISVIQSWLEKVLNNKVPSFEVNSETISYLTALKKNHEDFENHSKEHNNLLNHQIKEYDAEMKRINGYLKEIDITPTSLPTPLLEKMENICKLTVRMGLKSVNETYLLIGLSQLERDLAKISVECNTEQDECDELLQKCEKMKKEVEKLQKDVNMSQNELDEQKIQMEKAKKMSTFLSNKSQEYKTQIASHQRKLEAIGLDPSLYHSSLLEKYNEISKLCTQIEEEKSKLQLYNSLPCNEELADAQVEELRKKINTMDLELMNQMKP